MPIFEYVCKKCDHCFEHLMFSSSDPVPVCPECRSNKVRKLMSAGCVRPNRIPAGSGGFNQSACKPAGGG